jgi:dipeptidyl-peptidase-4
MILSNRSGPRTLRGLATLILVAGAEPTTIVAQGVTTSDYAAAAALLEANLRGTVKNQAVVPRWIGSKGAFWYRRDEADGASYVRFDPRTRAKTPLFDHAALATALVGVLDSATVPTATNLGLTNVTLNDRLDTLVGRAGSKLVTCRLEPTACQVSEPKPAETGLLPSPDAKRVAFIRDYNLVVREVSTGREVQLTSDGALDFGYGTPTDRTFQVIPSRKAGRVLPPVGTTWSPDGRYLLITRSDQRHVKVHPFVEWVPQDGSLRPVVHELRIPFVGDRERVATQLFLIEVNTGRSVVVTPPPTHPGLDANPVGWSVGRGQVFLSARASGNKSLALLRVELATGAITTVVEERSPTRVETNTVEYNRPNMRILGDGAELVWYSARSGWGHLYRYDAQTGALRNPITGGEWAVLDIHAVDERRRELYLTAGGREPGRDPYYRHLYKVGFDGGEPVLLTDVDADHHFNLELTPFMRRLFPGGEMSPQIQPDAGIFLDTYSTVASPPVTVLRSTTDGRILAEIERADASRLFATGWRAPVRERVKAADGTTDLYAVYYAPLRPVTGGKSPVIDAVYGGPQVVVAPKNFIEAYASTNPLGESGLARLGFGMIVVDGRGTPGRSNAFRDAGYPEFTQVGVDDHIAAIRQMAERHPEMDLERVGVYGWSWGGTFAAQAILSRPEFYDVSVSGAGVYDYAAGYLGYEVYAGAPLYANGTIFRSKPDDYPESWKKLDITAMAGNLKGHLMIIYGDLDENVPPNHAFRLVAALVHANKPHDLVYLPGRTHAGSIEGYTIRRTWDYFLQHLLGVAPIPDIKITYGGSSPR